MDRLCRQGNVIYSPRFNEACARLTRSDLLSREPGIQLGYRGHNPARGTLPLPSDWVFVVLAIRTGRCRAPGLEPDQTGHEVDVCPTEKTPDGWRVLTENGTFWFSQYPLAPTRDNPCPYCVSPQEIQLLDNVAGR